MGSIIRTFITLCSGRFPRGSFAGSKSGGKYLLSTLRSPMAAGGQGHARVRAAALRLAARVRGQALPAPRLRRRGAGAWGVGPAGLGRHRGPSAAGPGRGGGQSGRGQWQRSGPQRGKLWRQSLLGRARPPPAFSSCLLLFSAFSCRFLSSQCCWALFLVCANISRQQLFDIYAYGYYDLPGDVLAAPASACMADRCAT